MNHDNSHTSPQPNMQGDRSPMCTLPATTAKARSIMDYLDEVDRADSVISGCAPYQPPAGPQQQQQQGFSSLSSLSRQQQHQQQPQQQQQYGAGSGALLIGGDEDIDVMSSVSNQYNRAMMMTTAQPPNCHQNPHDNQMGHHQQQHQQRQRATSVPPPPQANYSKTQNSPAAPMPGVRDSINFGAGGYPMSEFSAQGGGYTGSALNSLAGLSSAHRNGAPMGDSVYHGIKRKIETLKAENDQLRIQNEALKGTAARMQSDESERANRLEAQYKKELMETKEQLQKAANGHLKSVKQLLHDKEQLTSKLEQLATQLANADRKREAEVNKIQQESARTVSELKGRMSTQDKTKREQWAMKEAKKIKEVTLKAMEPDIALLMNRHKAELRRREEDHAEALRRKDATIDQKDREIGEMKHRLEKEMDERMMQEREAFRRRIEEEASRQQRIRDDEKRALAAKKEDLERETRDAKELAKRQVRELEAEILELKKKREEDALMLSSSTNGEYVRARAEFEEEVNKMREQFVAERREWEKQAEAVNAKALNIKEEEMQRSLRVERDKEIAAVVSKLEEEQMKIYHEFKAKDRRQQDDNKQLQRDNDRLRAELETTNEHVKSSREIVAARNDTITQREQEIARLRKELEECESKLESEIEKRLRALDAVWQQKLSSVDQNHVALVEQRDVKMRRQAHRIEVLESELKAQQQVSEQKHAFELSSLNERVMMTVARKDQQLRQLAERIASLESALRQREEELARHMDLLQN